MAAPRPLRRLLPILLALCPLTLAAETTVSIEDVIPSEGHECVSSCIDYPNVVGEDVNDIGSALACGIPYENACWCATATASINSVSKHINSCASNRCSAGDLDRDISTMRAVYAGYCLDAGFTQPLVSDWYTTSEESSSDDKASSTAEPSGTTDPGPAQTTTQLTLVTETTDGTAGGSRVVVDVTSTIWVDPSGSVVDGPGGGSGGGSSNKVGLGVGLGVGLTAALAIAGVGIWLCLRRRRRAENVKRAYESGGAPSEPPPSQTMASTFNQTIGRKPVPSPVSPLSQAATMELSGQGVSRELSGRDVHPLPDTSPSPPVAVSGQHEMLADTQRRGLPAQGTTPGQHEMAAESRPQEMVGSQNPRYELGQ